MEGDEFRVRGKELIDYMVDYMESVSQRPVRPSVEPGYLRPLLPDSVPEKGEKWEDIMKDFEHVIMPGITHWQHPRFHAYFPAGNSYPSVMADMLSDILGCVGFSWSASPAYTELETIMLDWMGKMIGLPDAFLTTSNGEGGGVIQGSASDCMLVNMLAARNEALKKLKQVHPDLENGFLLSRLIAYCSKEAHSCVEKASMICLIKLHLVESDENCRMHSEQLDEAMKEDRINGLVPFFVSITLGTTSSCSFDALDEIGPLCAKYDIWLHVDAAYAGNSFVCPEFQSYLKGVEFAMSFATNPNKWLLVSFDCSCMWIRDRTKLIQAFVVDPLYLQHRHSDNSIDYRHWGIPLSRRFRSLKLWFVFRSYGVEGLQNYIREHVRLAKRFEGLVRRDNRFEVMNDVVLGLVCFRLKGSNDLNHKLLASINCAGKLHMVPAKVKKKYVIRFCVCAQNQKDEDIDYAWAEITAFADELLMLLRESFRETEHERNIPSI